MTTGCRSLRVSLKCFCHSTISAPIYEKISRSINLTLLSISALGRNHSYPNANDAVEGEYSSLLHIWLARSLTVLEDHASESSNNNIFPRNNKALKTTCILLKMFMKHLFDFMSRLGVWKNV